MMFKLNELWLKETPGERWWIVGKAFLGPKKKKKKKKNQNGLFLIVMNERV